MSNHDRFSIIVFYGGIFAMGVLVALAKFGPFAPFVTALFGYAIGNRAAAAWHYESRLARRWHPSAPFGPQT